MRNTWKAVLLLSALALASDARAVDITNFRPCYAPIYLGATRTSDRILPGDILFATYDIENLKLDPKTGKANFVTVVEIFDDKATRMDQPRESRNEPAFHLGGNRIPGEVNVELGRNLKPGKYHVRLTIFDRFADKNSKDAKAEKIYSFELAPKEFGIGAVVAPAVGFLGLPYSTEFALFDLPLDAAKQPKVELVMSVLDANKKPVVPPVVYQFPRDLPTGVDLAKENFVPVRYPMFLNRPGRFTIDIHAKDAIKMTSTRLTYTLTVLDLGASK